MTEKQKRGRERGLPEETFPLLISWKTADIPCFGFDEEGWEGSELKREAGGGGGGAGAPGGGAFDGALDAFLPEALHTGPRG